VRGLRPKPEAAGGVGVKGDRVDHGFHRERAVDMGEELRTALEVFVPDFGRDCGGVDDEEEDARLACVHEIGDPLHLCRG
jgi:hypothetical protein